MRKGFKKSEETAIFKVSSDRHSLEERDDIYNERAHEIPYEIEMEKEKLREERNESTASTTEDQSTSSEQD